MESGQHDGTLSSAAVLPCEREMFAELMDYPFPGIDQVTPEIEERFGRKAIARCWKRMYETTKRANPDCQIWVTCCDINSSDLTGSEMFSQADLFMNEAGDIESVEAIRSDVGKHTQLLTCFASWNQQDPSKIIPIPEAVDAGIGLYGFTKPGNQSLLPPISHYLSRPVDDFQGDERNVAYLARIYNGFDWDYIPE